MPHFSQDFDADFDQAVAGLLPGYSGEPYALVRFGDGEGAAMWGEEHAAKSDGWRWDSRDCRYGSESLASRLMHAMECELPGWHVGIPAEEHDAKWHGRLKLCCDLPSNRMTFAEIFCFANYRRFVKLNLQHTVSIDNHESAGFQVPSFPQDPAWPDAVKGAVDFLLGLSGSACGPITVAAGPWAKVVIFSYWAFTAKTPQVRQTIIDVGSALSPRLFGRNTRRYHNPRSPKHNWTPKWTL